MDTWLPLNSTPITHITDTSVGVLYPQLQRLKNYDKENTIQYVNMELYFKTFIWKQSSSVSPHVQQDRK